MMNSDATSLLKDFNVGEIVKFHDENSLSLGRPLMTNSTPRELKT